MRLHTDFTGGNLRVVSVDGDSYRVEPELRDTTGDWFYWAFCVEGAAGRTLTFDFSPHAWVGPFGPAVSRDLRRWNWLYAGSSSRFTYTFTDDAPVYFAHDLLYHPGRFVDLAAELSLPVSTLCSSERGRDVPCVRFGSGEASIVLTARHHCCEATGSYVLEGILREFAASPLPGYEIFAVPFVDYDGVLDGDQGKNRFPHDHNRDYLNSPLYASVRAVQEYEHTHTVRFLYDLHSPWHCGGSNDHVFIVRPGGDQYAPQVRFGQLLEEALTRDAMHYRTASDLEPETGWNLAASMNGSCRSYASGLTGMKLALTLETTYFGEPDHVVTQENLISLGRAFARAMRRIASEQAF